MDWKDEYSVGILEIDNQHKAMLRSFSIIEETFESGQDRSNTHYAIVELIQLSRMHFLFEEAMMRMYDYPESESHKKCHQQLMIRLDSVERNASNNASDFEIVKLMRDYLMAHMLGDDKGYAQYILSGAQVVKSREDS